MSTPKMIDFGGEQYELRSESKDYRLPYFPAFTVTCNKDPQGHSFSYSTTIRKKDDGVYFDIPFVYQHFVGDHMIVMNPNKDILRVSEQLLAMVTSQVYRHLILYNTSNTEPSDYQIDEALRLKLQDKLLIPDE